MLLLGNGVRNISYYRYNPFYYTEFQDRTPEELKEDELIDCDIIEFLKEKVSWISLDTLRTFYQSKKYLVIKPEIKS